MGAGEARAAQRPPEGNAVMEVPDCSLTLTKAEAATRQVEAAIEALARGQLDAAVTLADAAEGMIDREGLTLYNFVMNHPKVQHLPRKMVNSHLNHARDWLKHSREPDTLELSRFDAAEMIARAASKLEASSWTPQIDAFRAWFIKNIDDLIK
jgi:hypothetical protein